MNKKQLLQLGVPEDCVTVAVQCIHAAAETGELRSIKPKQLIPKIVADPHGHRQHSLFGRLADALIELENSPAPHEPIDFAQFGEDIDEPCKEQMQNACRLPMAVGAALMPDAHLGYGLPIGGVLACENAVVPYAVGVDIACRMRLTITDLPVDRVDRNEASECGMFDDALVKGTCFGAGKSWQRPFDHQVLDEDWSITAVTRQVRDKAVKQLGTSGSGNHFVEWGIVRLPKEELGVPAGEYVGLLSHSGSRGPGAQVCKRYTDIAMQQLPPRFKKDSRLKHLAWLDLSTEEGQEYWLAMNLMGRFAAANHEVIHQNVAARVGATALAVVENHHNFAWKEKLGDKELIVHRKGATPAAEGTLGVIPGSMASPAFIVRGRGNRSSLNSASHGAGRRMSRKAAKDQFRWHMWKDVFREQRVRLLAGGLDEVPGAYKDIREVMDAQDELVETLGEFHPRIVMMCGDGSPAED